MSMEEHPSGGPKKGSALPVSGPGHNITPLLYLQNIVIKTVMEHKDARPFLEPVDVKKLNIPDYHQIVKQPMDFGTIEKRLNNNFYQSVEVGIKDCNLVFTNSHLYNKADSAVGVMARTLEKMFRHLLTGMPKDELDSVGIKVKKEPTESSKQQKIHNEKKAKMERELVRELVRKRERKLMGLKERQRTLMVNNGGEKQSAEDGSKSAKKAKLGASGTDTSVSELKILPMAFNEIKDLYHEIHKLSADKLLKVVKIIQRREGNKGESIGPNEVEIDLKTLEPKTLYFLKVFVEKTLGKNTKKTKSIGGKRKKAVTGGTGGAEASSKGGGGSGGSTTSG